MKSLPITVFCFILLCALCASIWSFRSTEDRITADVNKALALVRAETPTNIVSTDTALRFRNYLTIAEIKDTAGITMRTIRRGEQVVTEMVAQPNCSPATVFRLSNQRASATLLFISALWMMGSLWYVRRRNPNEQKRQLSYGGIVFTNGQFTTKTGEEIHFTPMQHSLLELFMKSDTHTLTKQEICSQLWPKKPNASDTLYTLIKRTKPIVETNSNLRITSNRGRSYSLEAK